MSVTGHELTQIALLTLGLSLPVVLIGWLIIRLARSWSVTVSMVALVLIPVLATFTGVLGAAAGGVGAIPSGHSVVKLL